MSKSDFRALPPVRRCYEEVGGELKLFWLHPDGKRDPIIPFGASLERLREIGYRKPEETVDND